MKKLLTIFAALTLIFSLAACNNNATEDKKTEDKGKEATKKIGVSLSTLNNPFFVTLKGGIEDQAKSQGYEVVTADAADDASKQLNDVQDFISKKVDLIIINPVDSDSVKSAVEAANKANIPVMTVDRSANGGEVVTHIASDNVAGGEMAGQFLLEQVGDNAKVVELEGVPGASATRDRGEGFHNVVDGKADVVAKQTANFNRQQGLDVMTNIINSGKDFKGVFAHNDEMALGAVQALKAAGKTDVVVVGFDATDDAVKAVKDGEMKATVAQKPAEIGKMAIDAAKDFFDGKTLEKMVKVPLELVK
ncbi:MAG: D-ribose transporter substrate-binding protein [Bacillales bacterium]|nr:D-ribose transporter substrate-binding protein [Bacillales bacterium]